MKLVVVGASLLLAGAQAHAQVGAQVEAPAGAPAAAQEEENVEIAAVPDNVRVNQLIIYGDDPCPQSSEGEIIVCARKPEGERYRIPENLRDLGNPESQAWTNRATELQYVGRTGIGSCSPAGPGGMVGCLDNLIGRAMAEREGRDSVDWNRLIESARQERLGRIDEEAEAIEQELNPRPE